MEVNRPTNGALNTLQESGAPLAPPARRVGTGVTLAPITPSITTSRIRREEPEDIPQIASKDKGKGRDLTNLGSSDTEEIDEGEDDEAEKSDEEGNKEKDADAGSNGDEDGEPKKTDDEDDDEDDSTEVPMHADFVEVMCTLVVQMYNKVALYQAPGSHALGTTHRHCQHPLGRPRSSWDDWC
ncbi:hypothetical protein PC9H_006329 [Pleurotus ostreatus]|uniref:Uncharacterized protein n=1 Tax=Pleurotus ostreatus TaxID=5322 RepID=A0A8H7DSS5_PLEOS|nr:uncharacterized protein PC9H_006329 [Pleurotus ostreatus]KAF7430621.1 hypothetical protein PC9H_006329 [Pleurotus ostreatus]